MDTARTKKDSIVTKFDSCYFLLKIETVDQAVSFTAEAAQQFIEKACEEMLGLCGSAFPINLVRCDATGSAIVKVPHDESGPFAQVMAAATEWNNGAKCRVSVLKSSPFLVALLS